MTRKEQIFEYLKERNIPITSLEANSIMEGIMWADEHPKSGTVNKQEFIEQAKIWLKNNIDEDVFVKCGNVVKIMDACDFGEYFCKVMESVSRKRLDEEVVKLWIARSKDYDFSISNLTLFSKEPKLSEELEGFWVCSQYDGDVDVITLPSEMFPELTVENSPQMVELKLVK